ncbi:hypothetical protein O0I10_011782 [Lichtheimia ornata]|uniref:Uncharacterized protein n=1 Tax=Lichtheimia ornata TaxID=688661 RepID=A0AAD7UTX7_9FUNG|nr:uncharacterized protein O0I10_011782 [Lichtheimia ornata]KAJ8652577.1 hypothetical protein O0I10_011782 [Lichtheimia ornata]
MTSKGLDALLKFLLTSDKLQQVRNQARGRRKHAEGLEKKDKMGATNYRSNYWKRISQRITLRYKEEMALMRHEGQSWNLFKDYKGQHARSRYDGSGTKESRLDLKDFNDGDTTGDVLVYSHGTEDAKDTRYYKWPPTRIQSQVKQDTSDT